MTGACDWVCDCRGGNGNFSVSIQELVAHLRVNTHFQIRSNIRLGAFAQRGTRSVKHCAQVNLRSRAIRPALEATVDVACIGRRRSCVFVRLNMIKTCAPVEADTSMIILMSRSGLPPGHFLNLHLKLEFARLALQHCYAFSSCHARQWRL